MSNEKQFEEINQKIDKISDHVEIVKESLHRMDKTLVRQEENLREHMRRTDLNEKSIESVRDDLKPIKRHVNMLEGALKFLGIVSLLLTILTMTMKALGLI